MNEPEDSDPYHGMNPFPLPLPDKPAEHEHEWQRVGKRWDVCTVEDCAVVKLELRAEWYDSDKRPRDCWRGKTVVVLLKGEIQ